MNIPLNDKEYNELIKLIYWTVLEKNINYNEDFQSMCNSVRTADGATLEECDPLFSEDFTEDDQQTFYLIFMFYVKSRYSECCDQIAVNPLTKVALVRYTNGNEYRYSNVSRRSIITLMFHQDMSLGFWINKVKRQKNISFELTGFNISRDALITN